MGRKFDPLSLEDYMGASPVRVAMRKIFFRFKDNYLQILVQSQITDSEEALVCFTRYLLNLFLEENGEAALADRTKEELTEDDEIPF